MSKLTFQKMTIANYNGLRGTTSKTLRNIASWICNCSHLPAIITGIFGQIGDFSESAMKRQVYVKDTGTILMGHGGFLDRFDSLSFAAPLYYVYILMNVL